MASANLDFVRSMYAAFERGDYSSAKWAHPKVELVIVDRPAPGSWTELAEIAKGFGGWLNAWEDFRVEADEVGRHARPQRTAPKRSRAVHTTGTPFRAPCV